MTIVNFGYIRFHSRTIIFYLKMSETQTLDVEHPKLEAFQLAVKTLLLKRIREADEEIARLNKEASDKAKAREEQTQKLHESQRELKQEQQRLAETERELFDIRESRLALETENKILDKNYVLTKYL